MGFDVDRFDDAYKESMENSSFVKIDQDQKLVVRANHTIRIVGDFASNFEHFVLLPTGKSRPIYCGGPKSDCPLCALIRDWSILESPTEELKKTIDSLRARERFYFNVLDRSEEGKRWHHSNRKMKLLCTNERGINVGTMILQAFGGVCRMLKDQGQDNNPETFDIYISRTGAKFNTKYTANFTGNREPLTSEELEYEPIDVNGLAKFTPQSEVETIVEYLSKTVNSGETNVLEVNKTTGIPQPSSFRAPALPQPPPAIQQPRQQQSPIIPPPSQPIVAQQQVLQPPQPPGVAPAISSVSPPPSAPKLTLPKQQFSQKNKPTADFDDSKGFQVPCAECGSTLQILQNDIENITCWNCGKVFSSPFSNN